MDMLLPGDREEALARLGAVADAAGWDLVVSSPPPHRLVPRTVSGPAAPGAAGWVLLTPSDDGWIATLWLPDSGDAAARERLESALDRLVSPGNDPARAAVLRRLRRIEGQVRGLQRMIGSGRDCEAVMTQLAATSTALKQAAARIVTEHFAACVKQAVESGEDVELINQRLLNILF